MTGCAACVALRAFFFRARSAGFERDANAHPGGLREAFECREARIRGASFEADSLTVVAAFQNFVLTWAQQPTSSGGVSSGHTRASPW